MACTCRGSGSPGLGPPSAVKDPGWSLCVPFPLFRSLWATRVYLPTPLQLHLAFQGRDRRPPKDPSPSPHTLPSSFSELLRGIYSSAWHRFSWLIPKLDVPHPLCPWSHSTGLAIMAPGGSDGRAQWGGGLWRGIQGAGLREAWSFGSLLPAGSCSFPTPPSLEHVCRH